MSTKKRVIALDILKVFAVLLVLNSHMEICYGKYSILATGGAIGDALFFFASGFMLFRGPNVRFDHFMKRRISRIYPTVFIVAIVGDLLFDNKSDIVSILLYGGGWFVSCIMIYYLAIWIIKHYFRDRLIYVWIGIISLIVVWYFCFYNHTLNESIYGNNYLKWGFFFIFMLQGAIMGSSPEKYVYNKYTVLKLVCCVILWYGLGLVIKYLPILSNAELISLLPLYGICYYIYILCCAPIWKKLYNHKGIGDILYIIGGLCLECYLIQFYLFTDKLNWLFPINVPIIMIYILLISYGINFLSSAFSQTFSNNPYYEWRKCLLKKPK